MSVRAELMRLGLRLFVKRVHPSVAHARAGTHAIERLVPSPPKEARTSPVDAGGVPGVLTTAARSRPDRHVLFLHGGAYVTGTQTLYRNFLWRIATTMRAEVLFVDYRLAPEHPFPAALDDAFAAWQWLIAAKAAPQRTVIMGDSAGGGLTLALLLKLRDENNAQPGAAVALSPWTDLAFTGDSLIRNGKSDPMLTVAGARILAESYLGDTDPRHPYVSPLYGDPTGLPPTLIHVGSDEILLDDSLRMAHAMRTAGCHVEIEVWPRMPHVWHAAAPAIPESNAAIARIGAFVDAMLTVDDEE